jgi:hypothetical protein
MGCFFVERWPLLAAVECRAIQQWVLWLADQQAGFNDDALMRSYETLQMLAARSSRRSIPVSLD